MIDGLFIREDKPGKYYIASAETMQPVTIDMEYEEAVNFMQKMLDNKRRASVIKPDSPKLYYNRWEL